MNLFNCHTHFSKNKLLEIQSISPDETASSFHSLGIHPWKAHTLPEEKIEDAILKKLSVSTLAIGEIGLDRLKGPNLERQISVFIQQIEIAEAEKLPVILHCVKTWNEISLVKRKLNPAQAWIYHGFAKANLVDVVLQENVIISLGADVLTNKKLQKVVYRIPNNMLLLETDESKISIDKIYEKVAELKGISLLHLAEIIEKNVKRIFPKWQIG